MKVTARGFREIRMELKAHGNTAGLYAVDDNDGSAASIAAGGYGVQAVGSRIGIFGSGSDAGLYGIDSSTVKYGYVGYGSYSFFGNGDLSVPNNDRSSCVTVGVASGAGTFQCTGAKFMSGVRKIHPMSWTGLCVAISNPA